jgi:hypothetical protein
MENNRYFTEEALKRIGAAVLNAEGGESKQTFHREEKKKKIEIYRTEMYEPNFFKDTVRTDLMRASDCFGVIAKKFGDIFSDFRGCQLEFGPNGMPEFVLVFEYGVSVSKGKVQALKPIYTQNRSSLETVIEASRTMASKGFRTLDLTDEAKGILLPFMSQRVTVNGGGQIEIKEVNWDNCVFEKQVGNMVYGHPTHSRVAFIVHNIDIQKIINNIIATPEQKEKDFEDAKKKYMKLYPPEKKRMIVKEKRMNNGVETEVNVEKLVEVEVPDSKIYEFGVTPRFQSSITFRGYMNRDQFGYITYTQQQQQMTYDGRLVTCYSMDWTNYWLTIQILDTYKVKLIAPMVSQPNDGFFSTLITP